MRLRLTWFSPLPSPLLSSLSAAARGTVMTAQPTRQHAFTRQGAGSFWLGVLLVVVVLLCGTIYWWTRSDPGTEEPPIAPPKEPPADRGPPWFRDRTAKS